MVVGAGPVGTLAALYAAGRGDDVEVYEYREGKNASNLSKALTLLHTVPTQRWEGRAAPGSHEMTTFRSSLVIIVPYNFGGYFALFC